MRAYSTYVKIIENRMSGGCASKIYSLVDPLLQLPTEPTDRNTTPSCLSRQDKQISPLGKIHHIHRPILLDLLEAECVDQLSNRAQTCSNCLAVQNLFLGSNHIQYFNGIYWILLMLQHIISWAKPYRAKPSFRCIVRQLHTSLQWSAVSPQTLDQPPGHTRNSPEQRLDTRDVAGVSNKSRAHINPHQSTPDSWHGPLESDWTHSSEALRLWAIPAHRLWISQLPSGNQTWQSKLPKKNIKLKWTHHLISINGEIFQLWPEATTKLHHLAGQQLQKSPSHIVNSNGESAVHQPSAC